MPFRRTHGSSELATVQDPAERCQPALDRHRNPVEQSRPTCPFAPRAGTFIECVSSAPIQASQNAAQKVRAINGLKSPELKQNPINTEFVQHQALVCATVQNVRSEEEGFEPPQDSPEKTTVSEQGGAQSGAHAAPTAVSDSDLGALISAWPELPEAVRAGIVAMVKAASCTTLHGDERHE